jgi:hypothetical protein
VQVFFIGSEKNRRRPTNLGDTLPQPVVACHEPGAKANSVPLGKTGTDTNFLLLEIGCLSQRFAALTEQCWR